MSREPHWLALLLTHQLQKLQVSHAMAAPLLQHASTTSQPLVDVVVRREGGAASLPALQGDVPGVGSQDSRLWQRSAACSSSQGL